MISILARGGVDALVVDDGEDVEEGVVHQRDHHVLGGEAVAVVADRGVHLSGHEVFPAPVLVLEVDVVELREYEAHLLLGDSRVALGGHLHGPVVGLGLFVAAEHLVLLVLLFYVLFRADAVR